MKIDRTAPTLAPSVGVLLVGSSIAASPGANDGLSGIASQSCGALDTASAGTRSVTCTATDNAGNTATATLDYTVQATALVEWTKPAQSPLFIYQVSANKPLALEWRVVGTDWYGIDGLGEATLSATQVTCPAGRIPMTKASTTAAPGPQQALGDGKYARIWQVPAAPVGRCYRLGLDVGDGISRSIYLKIRN